MIDKYLCVVRELFAKMKVKGVLVMLHSELDKDSETFTLSVIKKEEVENTDEKQVFKKTKVACATLNEADVNALIKEDVILDKMEFNKGDEVDTAFVRVEHSKSMLHVDNDAKKKTLILKALLENFAEKGTNEQL